MNSICAIILVLSLVGRAEAKTPEWAKKNTQQLLGKTFITTCSGTGPSLDTARRDALDSCRLSARQQLASNIEVRSLTIQSENSAGFHEEVTENGDYDGLICVPSKDEVEETDGGYRVWIQCRFDLAKVKVHRPEKIAEPQSSPSSSKSLGTLQSVSGHGRDLHDADNFTLMISVVPKCDSLLIRGKKPRQVACDANPMKVVLDLTDKTILVRAAGFHPKTITIESEKANANIQVLLDKN
jgi:hypothetical protein